VIWRKAAGLAAMHHHPIMLAFLPPVVRGCIAALLLALNTIFWCMPLFAGALVKLALPFDAVRRGIDPLLNAIAGLWIRSNSGWMRLTQRTQWDVQGLDQLRPDGWYLVNCNHQSWSDIFVLQHLLNGRIPMLKFFLKRQLIWVPVIGLAWWALDFPFMHRHGKAQLRKHPELRSQDAQATRRACEKFALVPTSVMNFAEGTRFTPAKHRTQASPYRHLLRPKAGALALALNAMGDRFRSLIDVTIVYPDGAPTFWQFACGRAGRICVRVRQLPIPAEVRAGDYAQDPQFRAAFQGWLTALWEFKDAQIDAVLDASGAAIAVPAVPVAVTGTLAALALVAAGLGVPSHAEAAQALQATGLRAKYTAVAPQLRGSQFQGPLVLESVETSRSSQGDIYAVLDHPFARVSTALTNAANWCDILILHLNVKYCRGTAGPAAALDVRIGRKYDQPLASASQLQFAWRAVAATPEYLDVELDAPAGPFGTKDYRILVEAVAVDAGHTFMHLGYAFGYGAFGQMAMSSYLATIAHDKVGFSVIGGTAPGAKPQYVGGTRGLAERNTMRYYLAIDAYLDALAAPAAHQLDQRLEQWFAATEKYPDQLHEVERASYLAMKHGEVRRQQATAPQREPEPSSAN
jgi:1-acyl-sn-glycerol-3-phosphate acyltransferase